MRAIDVMSKLETKKNGCWEFTGAKDTYGYGNVSIDGKFHKAHRVSYALEHGDVPDEMVVCHRCDNPPCCNPDHLFLGSKQDNYDDMKNKGRDYKASGSKSGQAKLHEEDVKRIREAYLFGARQIDLAAAHGISQSNVSRIVRREWWVNV